MTPEQEMYNAAKAALGSADTLDPSTPIEYRCAEAWSTIAKAAKVQEIPESGFENTDQVDNFCATNNQFQLIAEPEPGATIVAVSEIVNGTITNHGHVAVCAMFGVQYNNDYGLISNDSNTGTVREQWSWEQFRGYYQGVLGLQINIYRRIA